MKYVHKNHGPPINTVTLRGHIEEVFEIADRIRNTCRTYISREVLSDIQDEDDLAEITFTLCKGHNLTKKLVRRFVQEQNADSIHDTYNNTGGNHETVGNGNS